MTDLPTRLEGAAAGSRELDYAMRKWLEGFDDYWSVRVPADWTTSIDAAVAFAERIGLRPYSADASIVGRWRWMVVNPALLGDADAEPFSSATAATPALALCAAIIRAHAEQVQG